MNADNQTPPNEEETFVIEQNTEITPYPSAPNFDAAEAAPVQPVVPVATLPVAGGVYEQQPQVVYVPQPTAAQPPQSWGWVPAALILLVVATVAGVFIGAELYKRSIYAESANAPYSSQDVVPSDVNANSAGKSAAERNFSSDKDASTETVRSIDDKSEIEQVNSVSTGFAPVQKTSLKETENNIESTEAENGADENNRENAEQAENNRAAEKSDEQAKSNDDEEEPPPPAQRKEKDFQPKKVDNVKDTENIAPPQRSLPNF